MFPNKICSTPSGFFICSRDENAGAIDKTLVSPLQTGHYSPGLMNILDDADPAPVSGLTIIDYNTFQYGNQFYGKNGKQITQITGPTGNLVNLNADVSGYNNSLMIQWASKGKFLGATYSALHRFL